jgi:hypothetical protein
MDVIRIAGDDGRMAHEVEGGGADLTARPRRSARLLRSPLALACMLVALAGVGLAARRVFASDETRINWLLEQMVDDANDGDAVAALRPFWKPPATRQLQGLPGTRYHHADAAKFLRAAAASEPRPRMELIGRAEVELYLDDSIHGAIAEGSARLWGGGELEALRYRVYLSRLVTIAPWSIGWQVTGVEIDGGSAALPELPR